MPWESRSQEFGAIRRGAVTECCGLWLFFTEMSPTVSVQFVCIVAYN